MFLVKGVLKVCTKFTREQPCRSAISLKMFCSFIEIALWHGCSPVNLLHIFRTTKNISEGLLLWSMMLGIVQKSWGALFHCGLFKSNKYIVLFYFQRRNWLDKLKKYSEYEKILTKQRKYQINDSRNLWSYLAHF